MADNKDQYTEESFHAEEPVNITLRRIEQKIDAHIAVFNEHSGNVRKAFVKDDDGEPDFRGHRDYHARLINRAAKDEMTRQRVMDKVITGSIWGIVLFIASAVWQAIMTKIGK